MRAIDADAVPQEFWEYEFDGKWRGCTIKDLLDSQPTIQPDNNSENPNGSDVISRQAAIDALDCINGAEEVLRALPSAQPEILACGEGELNVPDTNVGDMISRQAAIDALDEQIEQCNKALSSFDISPKDEYAIKVERASLKAYRELLENLPSAQPERKRGEWIRYGENGEPNDVDTVFWQCDQCLNTETGRRDKPMDFCPNCGADMRGGEME